MFVFGSCQHGSPLREAVSAYGLKQKAWECGQKTTPLWLRCHHGWGALRPLRGHAAWAPKKWLGACPGLRVWWLPVLRLVHVETMRKTAHVVIPLLFHMDLNFQQAVILHSAA